MARRVGPVPMAAIAGAVAVLVVLGFLAGVRYGAPEPIELPIASAQSPPPVATTQPSLLQVHLAGAVRNPGLYEVPAGYRAGDLVEVAGGFGADADHAAVNLAERVRDGQQIYVPAVGEPRAPAGTGADSGPINVNTAAETVLVQLPGIGPSLAAAIVEHRASHGPFSSLDALLDVAGIGPAKLAQLRPHAAV